MNARQTSCPATAAIRKQLDTMLLLEDEEQDEQEDFDWDSASFNRSEDDE